jgi:hypothetical protein
MLSPETRLKINDAEVTATVIDSEAIMINLTSGVYYSTDGAGARIWQLASGGVNPSEISELIATEYSIPQSQAAEDIERFLGQFLEEGLLVPYSYTNAPILDSDGPAENPYQTPELEIYREIGHLLALDPPMPGLENINWDEPSHA